MALMLIACERMAIERRVAGTVNTLEGIQRAGLETRSSHEDLEHRSRRKAALNRAILHRLARIVDQVVPVDGRDARRKQIWIIARTAHHGEDLARSRIEYDNGAGMVCHFGLSS